MFKSGFKTFSHGLDGAFKKEQSNAIFSETNTTQQGSYEYYIKIKLHVTNLD